MTLPVLIFGCTTATLVASLFHLWKGGGFWRFLLYILAAWAGFWAGDWFGDQLDLSFWDVGAIRMGVSLIGCLISLLIGNWLSIPHQNSS